MQQFSLSLNWQIVRRPVSILLLAFGVLLQQILPANAEKPEKPVKAENNFVAAHGDFFHLLLPDRSDINFTYRFEPKTQEDGGPGEYQLNLFRLEGELPLPEDRDTYLRVGGVYEARSYDFSSVRRARVEPSSEILHTAALRLGAGRFINDNLLLSASGSLGAYSDFSGGLDEDDFDLQGEAMAAYRLNPGAQLVAGIAHTEEFEDVEVLPFAGVRLLSEDGTIHISLTIPREVTVSYAFNTELTVYGGGWVSGNEYHVKFDGDEFDLAIRERRVGVGLQWWLGPHVRFSLEGGLLVGSELEFKTEDAGQFDGDLEPSPYLGAGLGFSL